MSENEQPKVEQEEIIEPHKNDSPIMEGPVPEGGSQKAAYCWYAGLRYNHGSVIKQGDGNLYICCDGQWWRK